MRARDVDAPRSFLETRHTRAMRDASRPLEIVLCYEVGYDGFWLARLLIARGIRTIVSTRRAFSNHVEVGYSLSTPTTVDFVELAILRSTKSFQQFNAVERFDAPRVRQAASQD